MGTGEWGKRIQTAWLSRIAVTKIVGEVGEFLLFFLCSPKSGDSLILFPLLFFIFLTHFYCKC